MREQIIISNELPFVTYSKTLNQSKRNDEKYRDIVINIEEWIAALWKIKDELDK